MCRLFAVFAITLLVSPSAEAQAKTDRERDGLVGAVRSVSTQVTDYSNRELSEEVRTKQLDTVAYGVDGNEVERTIYDDYGYLVGKEVHTYNANHNRIESTLSDPKGLVMEKRRYTYEKGKLIQVISYDEKGAVGEKQVNSYDANNRLRVETYYVAENAVGKTIYKYAGAGNVSEVAFFLNTGARAVASIGPCLGAHRVVYSYDGKGNLIKIVAYEPNGKSKKSWEHVFNPKGELAQDTQEDVWSHSKFIYTYEYDSQGNWIKKISTMNSRSKLASDPPYETNRVIRRVITYY